MLRCSSIRDRGNGYIGSNRAKARNHIYSDRNNYQKKDTAGNIPTRQEDVITLSRSFEYWAIEPAIAKQRDRTEYACQTIRPA